MKQSISLIEGKDKCCGCRACENICSKSAISIHEDEYGFIYPRIDSNKCIGCGLCKKVCAFQNTTERRGHLDTYVATSKTTDLLESASGGIFASIATRCLKNGGAVVGAALVPSGTDIIPQMIIVDEMDDLRLLFGSKYVQCDMGTIYPEIKRRLKAGQELLFSGTPCQVAAIKQYLGSEYSNLLTIDIICHGVPSSKLFRDYIKFKEEVLKIHISNYKFRDKRYGWKMIGVFDYTKSNSNGRSSFFGTEESYYDLFLKARTYRDSCYQCKYAGPNRPGDMTIGDYWGVTEEHPEVLLENGGSVDQKLGVSCLIVNSDKGRKYIETFHDDFVLYRSAFEKAQKHNGQLMRPSKESSEREHILNVYKNEGYKGVDKWFRRNRGIEDHVQWIKNRIPDASKAKVKRLLFLKK